LQQFADALIDMDVVVVDGGGKGGVGLVLGMAGIHGFPEGVVDAVDPHIHQHQKVGGILGNQLFGQGEALVAEAVEIFRMRAFSSERKLGTSIMKSGIQVLIWSPSSGGWVKGTSVLGVRKQETREPLTG
jgi:hypothetical protein